MVESGTYIKTSREGTYGPNLYKTRLIFPTSESEGVYAVVNSTYLTIIHEIGHPLESNHVPVAGNIMSYKNRPQIINLWPTPMTVFLVSGTMVTGIQDYSKLPMSLNDDDITPHMLAIDSTVPDLAPPFTLTARRGEQDWMALMCAYDFEDWKH